MKLLKILLTILFLWATMYAQDKPNILAMCIFSIPQLQVLTLS